MNINRLLGIATVVILGVSSLFAAEKEEKGTNFVFTKPDLEFLHEADLLDQRFEREGMVYHGEPLNSYVTRVGMSMLPAGTAPEHVKWAFIVLRDPMPNAFALPNGSIYVNTGLLSLLEDEDQLASVLAHEITHVTDRHGYLGYRDYRKKSTVISVAQFAGRMAPGNVNWGAAVQIAAAVAPIMVTYSIYGYRRELERDADIYAFNKILEGNYEPREMPNTFRLLEEKDEAGPPAAKSIYSDHPTLEDRISYVNNLIAAKAPPLTPSSVLAERKMRFQSLTEPVVREDIRICILSDHPRTALARATKLVEFHPDSADNLYAIAEAYRALGPIAPRPLDQELEGRGRKQSESLQKNFTPTERQNKVLSTAAGQATWEENRRKAEEYYQKALGIDPAYPKTYLGLGRLYEKEGKDKEAVAAYQKYVELNPNAMDSFWVSQRILALNRRGELIESNN